MAFQAYHAIKLHYRALIDEAEDNGDYREVQGLACELIEGLVDIAVDDGKSLSYSERSARNNPNSSNVQLSLNYPNNLQSSRNNNSNNSQIVSLDPDWTKDIALSAFPGCLGGAREPFVPPLAACTAPRREALSDGVTESASRLGPVQTALGADGGLVAPFCAQTGQMGVPNNLKSSNSQFFNT